MPFATIQEAAELYRRGELVIIVDDEDRENEGDLCIAAEKVTPETINFMARYGRGLIRPGGVISMFRHSPRMRPKNAAAGWKATSPAIAPRSPM